MAQQSAVESCREAGSDAERIACLEAALTGSSRQPETPAAEPSLPPSAGQETTPVEAPPEISESKPAEGTEAADSIGARQVRARQRSAADLESARGLRVARYDTVPFRRLQVELENGQVWRQIEGDTQRVRVDLERNRTVDIEESALGGYKLRLNEIARTIRVERIR